MVCSFIIFDTCVTYYAVRIKYVHSLKMILIPWCQKKFFFLKNQDKSRDLRPLRSFDSYIFRSVWSSPHLLVLRA